MKNFDLHNLLGFPLPETRSTEQEERLVRWLNDEWEDPEPKFRRWQNYDGPPAGIPMPADVPSDEDAAARVAIVTKFLPSLRRVQKITTARKSFERARREMQKHPGKYRDEDHAFREVSGLADKARLERMLASYTIKPTVPMPGHPSMMLVVGENMTEAWAAHILRQMASAGVLDKLKQCDCGCGKWKLKRRKNDRFFCDACRVRHHQADPDFKEKRRKQARERYRDERERNR